MQKQTVPLADIIKQIYNNQDKEYNIKRLIKRFRRIEKNMGGNAIEKFEKYVPDGDMKAYTDRLKENIEKNFVETMNLLRDKDFQDLLVNYPRPKKVFLKGYEINDTVEDEVMFRVGRNYQKPEDYLKLFEQFVKNNPEQIEAIEILLSRPKGWNTSGMVKISL